MSQNLLSASPRGQGDLLSQGAHPAAPLPAAGRTQPSRPAHPADGVIHEAPTQAPCVPQRPATTPAPAGYTAPATAAGPRGAPPTSPPPFQPSAPGPTRGSVAPPVLGPSPSWSTAGVWGMAPAVHVPPKAPVPPRAPAGGMAPATLPTCKQPSGREAARVGHAPGSGWSPSSTAAGASWRASDASWRASGWPAAGHPSGFTSSSVGQGVPAGFGPDSAGTATAYRPGDLLAQAGAQPSLQPDRTDGPWPHLRGVQPTRLQFAQAHSQREPARVIAATAPRDAETSMLAAALACLFLIVCCLLFGAQAALLA